jgi:mRNA-degrading endonuclease toxin of MazEF toxin-antitoxin module
MISTARSPAQIVQDNIHKISRDTFRRKVTTLPAARMAEACRTLQAATGC